MGLICVPLTERKRVKRHSQAIERGIVRHGQEDLRLKYRGNQLSVILHSFWLGEVGLHHSDKASDDPASSPPIKFTLSWDPISH